MLRTRSHIHSPNPSRSSGSSSSSSRSSSSSSSSCCCCCCCCWCWWWWWWWWCCCCCCCCCSKVGLDPYDNRSGSSGKRRSSRSNSSTVSPFHPIPRARNQCWFYKGLLWSQAQDLGIFWHPCRILFCFMTTTMASTTATTNTDYYVLGPNNPVRDIVHISYTVNTYIYIIYVYIANIFTLCIKG